jgi:type I restriction-modification system DNA methylase subunit
LMVENDRAIRRKNIWFFCGSGGMFVQSLKFLESHGGDKRTSLSMDKSAMMVLCVYAKWT